MMVAKPYTCVSVDKLNLPKKKQPKKNDFYII